MGRRQQSAYGADCVCVQIEDNDALTSLSFPMLANVSGYFSVSGPRRLLGCAGCSFCAPTADRQKYRPDVYFVFDTFIRWQLLRGECSLGVNDASVVAAARRVRTTLISVVRLH